LGEVVAFTFSLIVGLRFFSGLPFLRYCWLSDPRPPKDFFFFTFLVSSAGLPWRTEEGSRGGGVSDWVFAGHLGEGWSVELGNLSFGFFVFGKAVFSGRFFAKKRGSFVSHFPPSPPFIFSFYSSFVFAMWFSFQFLVPPEPMLPMKRPPFGWWRVTGTAPCTPLHSCITR